MISNPKVVITDYDYGDLKIEKGILHGVGAEVIPLQAKCEEDLFEVAEESRGMINDVEHPQLGKLNRLKAAGFPIQFSAAETGYKTPAVPSGTNNHEIFVGLLGLEESEYNMLKEESII